MVVAFLKVLVTVDVFVAVESFILAHLLALELSFFQFLLEYLHLICCLVLYVSSRKKKKTFLFDPSAVETSQMPRKTLSLAQEGVLRQCELEHFPVSRFYFLLKVIRKGT